MGFLAKCLHNYRDVRNSYYKTYDRLHGRVFAITLRQWETKSMSSNVTT